MMMGHDGVVILGRRNKGKSTLARKLLHNEPRVIVYDAKGEMEEPTVIPVGVTPYLPPRGVYRAFVPAGDNPTEESEWAAYIARELGRCIFVIDEVADAVPGKAGRFVSWNVRMGRGRDVRYLAITQRPTEMDRMFTAQATDVYLLQTNEPLDIEYIKRSVGTEASKIVRTLKQGHALHTRDGVPIRIIDVFASD